MKNICCKTKWLTKARFLWISGIVLMGWGVMFLLICLLPFVLLRDNAKPEGIQILAIISVILTVGGITAFSRLSYKGLKGRERLYTLFTGWIFIAAIVLMIALTLICIKQYDLFKPCWFKTFIFITSYLLIDGLVLMQIWKSSFLYKKLREE